MTFLVSISLYFIIILTGCAAGRGYNSIPLKRDSLGISAIMDSMYKLRTETVIKAPDGSTDTWGLSGIGLAIAPDLILSLNHVVSMDETNGPILSEMTYLVGAVREPPLQNNGQKIRQVPLKTLIRDRESDVALFKVEQASSLLEAQAGPALSVANGMPAPPIKPIPIAFGSSAELRIGDIVYLVGNAFRLGLNVRQGIVSALTGQAPSTAFFKPERTFMISNGVIPGDSGGPVLAIRDGQFELVGLAQGMISAAPNLGIALKIEFVMEKLGKYLGSPFYKKGFPDPSQKFSYESF